MLRTPYLPGETDMDQLKTIFRALGTPTEEEWPVSVPLPSLAGDLPPKYLSVTYPIAFGAMQGHTKLPDYVPVGQFLKTPLRDLFTAASGDALNMLSRCLIYEPGRRISALEVSYPPTANNITYRYHQPSQALHHPYFTSLPYPTHPSKLPKPISRTSRPLEEVDGNVDMADNGPGVKAAAPNRLKRKLSSPMEDLRPLPRRLDFTQHKGT